MCPPGMLESLSGKGSFEAAKEPEVARVRIDGPFRGVVDLTHTLSSDFPGYDGKSHFALESVDVRERDGFYGNRWILAEHVGTHLDAPIHFAEGGLSIEAIPLSDLIVPAAVVDVRASAEEDADAYLTVEHLRAWEAKHGEIPGGAAVLLWSGWDTRVFDGGHYRNADDAGVLHFPGFHPEAACFLRDERGVRGLGVDTLSLDIGASRDFPAHKAWLPYDRWGLECLKNLGALPAKGAVLVVGAPKVRGGSGGPVRVFALV